MQTANGKNLEGPWFLFDVETYDGSKAWRWYERLGVAACTLIHQWILIINGISSPGVKAPSPNDASLERLCEGLPTPKAEGSIEYPPFRFGPISLDEMAGDFEEDHGPRPVPTEFQLAISKQDREVHGIDNTPVPLPDLALREALEKAKNETDTIRADVQDAFAKMPAKTPLEVMTPEQQDALLPDHVPDILSLPPAFWYPSQLTPTEFALLAGNTTTKVEIIIALAQQEADAWNMLAARCDSEMERWQVRLDKLNEIRGLIKQSKQIAMVKSEARVEKAKQLDQAETEVREGTRNPMVYRQVQDEMRERDKLRDKLGSHQSPAPRPGYLSSPAYISR